METIKNWLIKRFLVETVGKAIAKAEGKRTWIGSAAMVLLLIVKYGLPVFFAIPPIVMEGVDVLLPIVGGSTVTFAGLKTQKAWEATKKIGDEAMKAGVASEVK